jgi:hypothetical protein
VSCMSLCTSQRRPPLKDFRREANPDPLMVALYPGTITSRRVPNCLLWSAGLCVAKIKGCAPTENSVWLHALSN